MIKIISRLSCLSIGIITSLLIGCAGKLEEPIDLEGLRSSGDDWTVLRQDTLADGGALKLHHDKWLMYFLHWRPLTTDREEVTSEYVRRLMLSFWGPDMPFTLSDTTGQLRVAGHQAYSVDGTIYEGRIHSRFIVWNCPRTHRQFISDCNINVGRGTAPELLDLQQDITLTIACHGQPTSYEHPRLTQEYVSEAYNLSFSIPANWRTNAYYDEKWFPEGLTATNGSLWTLLTDSEKYVELLWDKAPTALSENLFHQYLQRIESDSVVARVTSRLVDLEVDSISAREGYLLGTGSFGWQLQSADRQLTRPFLFKAFLWNYRDTTYFLLASMVSLQEFWQIPVDLKPTTAVFNDFLHAELLPNVRAFDKRYPD
ncbi:MAG: hypothetical protein ACETWG_00885 [Candidatus Neomarinimicrobiota bacterium]